MSKAIVAFLIAGFTCTCIAQQIAVRDSVVAGVASITAPATNASIASDALMLLSQFQTASGGVPFRDMQGTGTITLVGSAIPLPMELVIAGQSFVRVRISNSDRLAGFAARGALRKSYYVGGSSSLDNVGTGPASISAFQLLRTADAASGLLSLKRDVVVDSDGKRYDRLQARHAFVSPSVGNATSTQPAVSVDYYFDPNTHYLVRSLTKIRIPGIANSIPLETSYSDYRRVHNSLIPFRISQVLNGQPDWLMTLSSVTLSDTLDSTLTAF